MQVRSNVGGVQIHQPVYSWNLQKHNCFHHLAASWTSCSQSQLIKYSSLVSCLELKLLHDTVSTTLVSALHIKGTMVKLAIICNMLHPVGLSDPNRMQTLVSEGEIQCMTHPTRPLLQMLCKIEVYFYHLKILVILTVVPCKFHLYHFYSCGHLTVNCWPKALKYK